MWPYRIHAVVPVSMHGFYSALWTVIAPNGDYEALSFNVPFTDGNGITHYGMSTVASEEMVNLITQSFVEEAAGMNYVIRDPNQFDFIEWASQLGLQVVNNG